MRGRQRLTTALLLIGVAGVSAACAQGPSGKGLPVSAKITVAVSTTSTPSVATQLLQEARGFVYRVRNTDCLATGTSFDVGDGIATNRHVASGSSWLELATWNGNDFSAQVSALSSVEDLALVSGLPAPSPWPATLATSNPPPGTAVWAAGYPLGDQLSVLPGRVVDYIDGTPYGEPGQLMEITNAIQPGNSGSPLLDASGKVVGIVFALSTLDHLGLVIPISTVESFLAAPGVNTEGDCVG